MFCYNGKAIKSIGILGLGKSNLGVIGYLTRHYGELRLTLRCDKEEDAKKQFANRKFFGKDRFKNIDEDILFISPSARRDIPEIALAEKNKVILSSDTEFFFANTNADVYGITGSDGKSTTTYLTASLLRSSYQDAVAIGNIGEAMTPHLDDAQCTAFAAELSSFQLMYANPKCRRATITNITKNHLNWHRSFLEYISSKSNIFEKTKERIVTFDCPISRELAKHYDVFAVISRKCNESELRKMISAAIYVTETDGIIRVSGEDYLRTENIKVSGDHNVYNFMSAIALCYGQFRKEDLTELAQSFVGLRHRCELVDVIDGVKYYDSSIDSSPKRSASTLASFSERVILILGGQSKGLDFSELSAPIIAKAKLIVLTGECAPQIKEALDGCPEFSSSGIPCIQSDDFEDAVIYAAQAAKSGDNVLLSPAATSYDRFKNFEERGEAFAAIVKKIKNKR